jgi:hypothetical protein
MFLFFAVNSFVITNRHCSLQMDDVVLGAGCNSVVHVQGDFSGNDGTYKYIIYIKQLVESFVLSGTRLALSSPALLIKPYQLLGEKNV